jgi:leader peptidase (prepilin peptidase)/N-methyltransferase
MVEGQKVVLLVASGMTGLLVGSFLNVCIFRLPRNCMSIVRPRSRCPKCLHFIVWYDNIPVLSWILLGGKCRFCKAPISPRYALIELLTGALYFYAGWRALYSTARPGVDEAVLFVVEAWFLGALIVCTFIDFDFRILPDEVTLSGIVIGLAASAAFPHANHLQGGLLSFLSSVLEFVHRSPIRADKLPRFLVEPHVASFINSLFGAALGWMSIYVVGLFGKILFRKKIERLGETVAMGFGDVKYMAMLGAVLGPKGVLLTLVLASLLGTVYGLGKLIVLRRMGYVAFGPFLSTGALTMLFWPRQVDRLIQLYMELMNSLSARVVAWFLSSSPR